MKPRKRASLSGLVVVELVSGRRDCLAGGNHSRVLSGKVIRHYVTGRLCATSLFLPDLSIERGVK